MGRAVAPLLAGLGFRVVVVDDREEFASAERFPGAEVVVRPFEGALEAVGVDERAYVVIVTRGHVHDLDVLEQALRLRARYVGRHGSRSKRARMLAALARGRLRATRPSPACTRPSASASAPRRRPSSP